MSDTPQSPDAGVTTGASRSIDRSRLAAALNAIEAAGAHGAGAGGGPDSGAWVDAAWHAPRGFVVGITGPPGVGKSTLAGRVVQAWRAQGLTVAVLCIDPSSRASGGALLGDRLRMRLSGDDPDVFVRSMAARGELGGLAPKAFEAVTVMRAAADRVLVETVGVGQSEIAVSQLADLTLVVIQPGSGDALQFLKAGLMEVFDALVVNKADLGALAETAARELRSALRVQGHREVPVVTLSAEHNTGVHALMNVMEAGVAHDMTDKRTHALRETTIERFVRWHGERVAVALGGREALRTALDALAPAALTPRGAGEALESLVPKANNAKKPEPLQAGARPWVSEIEVGIDDARALVGAIAPELAHVTPELLGSGWDNTAWLFRDGGKAWVFRFPRRQVAVEFLGRELAVMPRLGRLLPLPVTMARWRGVMPNGWPFGGYRFLEGEIVATAGLDDGDKLKLAPTWGAFVRALHATHPSVVGIELPVDPVGKADVVRRWDVVRSELTTTGMLDGAIEGTLARARAVYTANAARPLVLSHGDLDGRHLLVQRTTSGPVASGVIDWGDVMLGDPAIDLALAYSLLEGDAREAFFDAYGQIDPDTEALARFRAIAGQAWVLSWALDIGHAEHQAEARRALGRAVR